MTSELSTPLIRWFRTHGRDLPWRRDGFTPWATLVSEFMLQQTQVQRVIPRLEEWLERWPTPADLARAAPGDAVRAWANLGYPRRALWLHQAATEITERHGGIVPRDVPQLLALKGIGDYTARAVAVFAYGDRHPVVDTNTRRVIARAVHGQAEAAPPSPTDLIDMSELLPEDDTEQAEFNAAIMELGAIVCTGRKPACDDCPIRDSCDWRLAGSPAYDGPRKPRQAKFEGSDRQVRGLILRRIRSATSVTDADLRPLWIDDAQRERALAGLIADGLVIHANAPTSPRVGRESDLVYRLP